MDEDVARRRFEAAIREGEPAFERFFLARLFGIEVEYDDAEETCTVRMPYDDYMNNPQGSLHGGVIATALDISMGHLCHRFLRTGVTLEMKTQFLRPVLGPTRCEAAFTKKGRRIAFTESTMRDESGKACAVATATWMLSNEERG